jgi:integrase
VHLDGERPRIVVRYSYRGPTKAGRVREVPLLERAREALRSWYRDHPALPHALVFPAEGGMMHTKGYDAQWASRWRKATGTRDAVRWHDLRHTCAAALISGTWGRAWSLEEVQAMLGHASRLTTERYAHLAPDAVHAAARETRPNSRHAGRHKATAGR